MNCTKARWTNPVIAYNLLDMLRYRGWLVGKWQVEHCPECGWWHLRKIREPQETNA